MDHLIDHFTNPRNVGEIEDANGVGEVGNASCGDIMKIFLKVEDGIIQDVKFKTFGCGSAIASSSLATEWLKGKSVDEAAEIDNMEIVEELALPPVKIHCSVLAEDESVSGSKRAKTRFGPMAFTDRAADTELSIPPETATTSPRRFRCF